MAAATVEATELGGGLRRIMLAGFLDAAAAMRLEERFLAEVRDAPGGAVVDLSEVEYCGSFGIRMLLVAARTVKRSGGRLVLASPRPEVRRVLETISLHSAIPIADSAEAAHGLARA
jgi:anti-anti-sigma factor